MRILVQGGLWKREICHSSVQSALGCTAQITPYQAPGPCETEVSIFIIWLSDGTYTLTAMSSGTSLLAKLDCHAGEIRHGIDATTSLKVRFCDGL
jgi:hypothetical protein